MARYRSGYVDVEVDLVEHIGEIPDKDLLDELIRRQLSVRGLEFDRDYAVRALEALSAGRRAEAIALLDMALFKTVPKREDVPAHLAGFL